MSFVQKYESMKQIHMIIPLIDQENSIKTKCCQLTHKMFGLGDDFLFTQKYIIEYQN